MAYRVPRRFIVAPNEPPPYGLFALSFLGHALFFLMMGGLSAYVNQADQSKIYVVNLVPAAPTLGSPEPRTAPPAPPATPPGPSAQERTPPRPERAEAPPPRETPPPKPERAETTPPKPDKVEAPAVKTPPKIDTPPPKAEKVEAPPIKPKVEPPPPKPEKAEAALPRPRLETPPPRPRPEDVAPPRAPEVARAVPPRSDIALPRKAERELPPPLETPTTRERLIEKPAAPPVPPAPSRTAAVPAAPAPPGPLASPAAVSRPGPEPVRPGRPDVSMPTTGNITLDVTDFPFTYYLRQVQAKISERWAPPRAATAGGERVIVLFEIDREGRIKEPVVEKRSGNELYDQSALRAVTEASPFPPLPPEFKSPSLKVHFGFEFKPDQG